MALARGSPAQGGSGDEDKTWFLALSAVLWGWLGMGCLGVLLPHLPPLHSH